jgi:hypothetical protein
MIKPRSEAKPVASPPQNKNCPRCNGILLPCMYTPVADKYRKSFRYYTFCFTSDVDHVSFLTYSWLQPDDQGHMAFHINYCEACDIAYDDNLVEKVLVPLVDDDRDETISVDRIHGIGEHVNLPKPGLDNRMYPFKVVDESIDRDIRKQQIADISPGKKEMKMIITQEIMSIKLNNLEFTPEDIGNELRKRRLADLETGYIKKVLVKQHFL